MRKMMTMFLAIIITILFASCSNEEITYKKINFCHDEILSKELVLAVPTEWISEEVCKDGFLVKNYNDQGQIGNISINNNYNGDKEINKIKEILVPIEGATYKAINQNCFVSTDKDRGNIITYLIEDKAIDIFLNILIDKKTVITIAKNITVNNFSKTQNISSNLTSSKPVDIEIYLAFLDDKNAFSYKKTYEQAYSVFLSINSLAEIIKKPGANLIGSSPVNRSMHFALEVNDGYNYYIIEDYLLRELIFAKSNQPSENANIFEYTIIETKQFLPTTTYTNTWDAFIMRDGFNKSMVALEQIDDIIKTANFYHFIKSGQIQPSSYELSNDKRVITFEIYCPELKAYFRVTEDYNSNSAFYGLIRIDKDDEVPMEYWKYNVSYPLSTSAKINNYIRGE